MSLNHAWMLKGWLLGAQNVPGEIMGAIDAVIESISAVEPRIKIDSVTTRTPGGIVRMSRDDVARSESSELGDNTLESPPLKPEKKKRNWSDEARAAAGERMSARMAAKKALKAADENSGEVDPTPEFTEAELRITAPVLRRKSTLTDDDWPDIKQMLDDGKSRTLIASDYDEEPEDLDFFIASCQRREQRGNFPAPSAGGA